MNDLLMKVSMTLLFVSGLNLMMSCYPLWKESNKMFLWMMISFIIFILLATTFFLLMVWS